MNKKKKSKKINFFKQITLIYQVKMFLNKSNILIYTRRTHPLKNEQKKKKRRRGRRGREAKKKKRKKSVRKKKPKN